MTRRKLLSTFAALVALAVIMLVGNTSSASAQQNPNCCTYTVDISNITDACLPVRLVTRWNCNPGTVFKTYTANGITIEPLGPPILPPCPPACRLLAVSIDNVNFIGPNQSKQIFIGNCCYIVSFVFDANGCIYIRVRRC